MNIELGESKGSHMYLNFLNSFRYPRFWIPSAALIQVGLYRRLYKNGVEGFPSGSVVMNPPAGDMGSIPDSGRSHMLWSNSAHVPQLFSLCSQSWEPQQEKPLQ